MTLRTLNPLTEPSWDDLVSACSGASVFHTTEWTRELVECYGYSAQCRVLKDAGRIVALLPVLEVSSPITGRRGVSLPFSDECPPLLTPGIPLESLINPLREIGRQRHWDYLEIRGDASSIPDAVPSATFLMHYLPLEGTEDQQFHKLSGAQQRNVRKARREGVEIHKLNTRDAMDAYYALHCRTRRRQGLPPQPRRFFHLIHQHLIEPGHGFVLLARFDNRWIAGAVFLLWGVKALYKFGASDRAFQHLRANSLLMWEAILHCRQSGATQLSFGRTDLWNSGLLQFKRSWGSAEVPLSYYRIGICKPVRPASQPAKPNFPIAKKLMQRMPLPLLRLIGDVLYKHIG